MKETEGEMFRSVKRKDIIKEATKIEKKKRKKRWWLKKGVCIEAGRRAIRLLGRKVKKRYKKGVKMKETSEEY